MSRPLIFVSNDDGYHAKGFKSLIDVVKEHGDVIAVSNDVGRSGMSQAITLKHTLRTKLISEEKGLKVYSCDGTPTDCVKIGLDQLVDRKPDFLVSGINHGSNASISSVYSGTIGTVREGCINGIPSIGFSLLNHSADADFTASKELSKVVFKNVLKHGLPKGTCLNVNYPDIPMNQINGLRVCRQTPGVWKQEFEKRKDPYGEPYYWLTGYFDNFEPESEDTDEWALSNGYGSIVPLKIDMTAYDAIQELNKWDYEI